MFSSLRTRIWFSYSLLVICVLCLVMAGVGIGLANSPIFYRNALIRLRLNETAISTRLELMVRPTEERVTDFLQKEADQRNIRLLIVSAEGAYIFDSDTKNQGELNPLPLPLVTNVEDTNNNLRITNLKGEVWFFTLRKLSSTSFLMAAIPRPKVALRTIFRDELARPFLRASILAVLLVVIISRWLSDWIIKPIRILADSTRRTGKGDFHQIALSGPTEVRQLTEAFNQMAMELSLSQQAQQDFLSNISHELKTPLTTIQGFAQALMDGTIETKEERNKAAEIIYSDANRLHRLVLDLLTLTRLEGASIEIEKRPVDLSALLTMVGDKLSLQAKQAGIVIKVEVPDALIVTGDGERLAQVFSNLVENGIKYTPPDGKVSIRARQETTRAVVEVIDTGLGIPPEDQVRIFERFYQADKSRKGGADRGFGLGLAIAQQIILAHDGKIWVESKPGCGSIFFVELPVHFEKTL